MMADSTTSVGWCATPRIGNTGRCFESL